MRRDGTGTGGERAGTLALQALAFLAADPDRIGRFLAQTGLAADELSALAADVHFQGGVLDYLLGDEALLLEFCEIQTIPPELPGRLRRALPGAAPDN